MGAPVFVDLEKLADELAGDRQFARLGAQLKKAGRIHSCLSDLNLAVTCCNALSDLCASPRKAGTLTKSATQSSLLMQAVALYVGATILEGKRGERGSIKIADSLSSAQLADHVALGNIRNQAQAHAYPGRSVEDEIWRTSELFLIKVPLGWRPAARAISIQFHEATFDRLKRQLPVAQSELTSRFHEQIDRAASLLHQARLPNDIFQRHAVDLVTTFGSVERARHIADNASDGGSLVGLSSGAAPII